jgi:hypothetical protein
MKIAGDGMRWRRRMNGLPFAHGLAAEDGR